MQGKRSSILRLCTNTNTNAEVAQLVERQIENLRVAGSNPALGTAE